MRFQTIFTLVVATLLSSTGVMAQGQRTSCKVCTVSPRSRSLINDGHLTIEQDCCDGCARNTPGSLDEAACLGNCGTYACNGRGC